MSRQVDEEFNRYVTRMPGVREASAFDATYSMQMKFIRRMLDLVDLAMESEGVSAEVRARVIRMVLFGSPDPDAAATWQPVKDESVKVSLRGTPNLGMDLP